MGGYVDQHFDLFVSFLTKQYYAEFPEISQNWWTQKF